MLINPGVILTNVSFINIGHENVTNTKKQEQQQTGQRERTSHNYPK